jgi:SpoVK/Ycf46/Vps4 family AAA+-type ATPase
VSPIVKTLMETLDNGSKLDDVLTVGQALSILCPDFHSQIAHRQYFYQSSRLLINAIISLAKSKWHVGSGDMTENRVTLDRRILDWVVGLDSEINELVEGSDLYEPTVELSQVVLPSGYAESILSQCASYDYFQTYRQSVGLHKSISYGNSLVILLCGKSGTGKTMTVNAVARTLKKKVLLVDFNGLLNKKDGGGGGDIEVDLKGLFRESKMSNTVLFFDECELIFKSRNLGSERLLNSLLTEIERHEGIVFMATNRPYEIDEAMHRRINMVLEFALPDFSMRKRIWDSILGSERVSASSTSATTAAAAAASAAVTSVQAALVPSAASPSVATSGTSLAVLPPPQLTSSAATTGSSSFLTAASGGGKAGKAGSGSLPLAPDVNTSELALRYELTGGFIKNAVLSALLTALSRDATAPLVSQADLICGCKLQMRGNLTERSFEDRVVPERGLGDLHLSVEHQKQLKRIVRHELARSKVFGEWTAVAMDADSNTSAAAAAAAAAAAPTPVLPSTTVPNGASAHNTSAAVLAPAPVPAPAAASTAAIATTKQSRIVCEQKASINLFAGTRGSGKTTVATAISHELGSKRVKYIHSSDFTGQSVAEITRIVKALVHDARIMDSLIVIDGFEHILDEGGEGDSGGGGSTTKLQTVLSRIMDILHKFHGCVCLLCHIENPQNITLKRYGATSRCFCFCLICPYCVMFVHIFHPQRCLA